jgi:integrase
MKPSAYDECQRHLLKHAAPLHPCGIKDVTREVIASLLNGIEDGSGPYARNRARAHLSSFWTYLIHECLAEANPVTGTRKSPEEKRDVVLSNAELAQLWQALPSGPFGDILRLLILTGQRRNEIGNLRWDEVAGDTIMLPPARVKNNRTHTIPLSRQAADIIARQPRRGEWVFGGSHPWRNWCDPKAELQRKLSFEFRLHDLRRTMATMAAEHLRIGPHIIETILNHVSGHKAGVAGTYNRALYRDEVRAALQRWADHVDGITSGSGEARVLRLVGTS